jgi:hypothetical protein
MGAAAAVILRKERDIVNTYRGVGATSPDSARSPDELDVPRRVAHCERGRHVWWRSRELTVIPSEARDLGH